jgi:hypothetical protein
VCHVATVVMHLCWVNAWRLCGIGMLFVDVVVIGIRNTACYANAFVTICGLFDK